jgi:hypothetical protein
MGTSSSPNIKSIPHVASRKGKNRLPPFVYMIPEPYQDRELRYRTIDSIYPPPQRQGPECLVRCYFCLKSVLTGRSKFIVCSGLPAKVNVLSPFVYVTVKSFRPNNFTHTHCPTNVAKIPTPKLTITWGQLISKSSAHHPMAFGSLCFWVQALSPQ